MIFGKEYKGEPLGELDLIGVSTSDNGHWLILTIGRGVPAKREDILIKDLRQPDAPIIPLIYGIDNRFNLIDTGTDTFLVETDMGAPKRRILRADPNTSPQQWQTVVPEAKDVIEASTVLGGKLFIERLVDVKNEISIYSLDGKPEGTLKLPGIGSATVPYGRPLEKEGFYSFNSFNVPPTIYRYESGHGRHQHLRAAEGAVPSGALRSAAGLLHVEGRHAGADVHRGQEGSATEWQDAAADDRLRRLPRQHDAGMEPDVCMVAGAGRMVCGAEPARRRRVRRGLAQGRHVREEAERLRRLLRGDALPDRREVHDAANLAIWGRSNGGLLMGAAMTQHPELYGAIVCGYPLLDMLRYQNFEFGRLWTTEYGSADNAADYKYIRAYSPYQNVKQGTKYPAIMFFSGDNDTRVDPLHARKMTAEMQAATSGDRPILLHYSLKGGHSSGVSVTQQIQDETDILSFLWNEMDTTIGSTATSRRGHAESIARAASGSSAFSGF